MKNTLRLNKLVFGLLCIAGLSMTAQTYKPDYYATPAYAHEEYNERFTEHIVDEIVLPKKSFYVSPDGDDNNDGSIDNPFASVLVARNAIRDLKEAKGLPKAGVQVVFKDGIYNFAQPLHLSALDGGAQDAPIIYRALNPGKVIIDAGREIMTDELMVVADEKHLEYLHPKAKGNVYSMSLPQDANDEYFKGNGDYGMLSLDGHLLQLAQWPNRGYHHIAQVLDRGPWTRNYKPGQVAPPYSYAKPSGGKFICKEELSPLLTVEFTRTQDVRVHGYFHNDWYFQNEALGQVVADTLQLLKDTRYGIENKIKSIPRRIKIVNVLAELDEPGEWYFDKQENRLYLWPIKGADVKTSNLKMVGGNTNFMCKEQSLISLKNTSNVVIKDFIFENTGEVAVDIYGGRSNAIISCTFRNGLGCGATISGGKYNGINSCDFYDLQSAFHLSGGEIKILDRCYNYGVNNIIRACRRKGYGVANMSGCGLYFAHNLLYNMNGAVSFTSVDMLMEYNEYYNVGYEMGDFNVAYCCGMWHTQNNILRYNFVHHLMEVGGHPVMAFRNDDNGSGLHIYGNVFYRSGRGAVQGDGPNNTLRNNINLGSGLLWWTLKKHTDEAGIAKEWNNLKKFGVDLPKYDKGDNINIIEREIGIQGWKSSPWIDEYPQLNGILETNPFAQTYGNVSANYMDNLRKPLYIHGGSGTVAGMESKEVGRFVDLPREGRFEVPYKVTLNDFTNPDVLDFSFKSSFVIADDFTPIPFDKMGLVENDFRSSVPSKDEYRSAIRLRYENEKGGRYNPELVNARYPIPEYLK